MNAAISSFLIFSGRCWSANGWAIKPKVGSTKKGRQGKKRNGLPLTGRRWSTTPARNQNSPLSTWQRTSRKLGRAYACCSDSMEAAHRKRVIRLDNFFGRLFPIYGHIAPIASRKLRIG